MATKQDNNLNPVQRDYENKFDDFDFDAYERELNEPNSPASIAAQDQRDAKMQDYSDSIPYSQDPERQFLADQEVSPNSFYSDENSAINRISPEPKDRNRVKTKNNKGVSGKIKKRLAVAAIISGISATATVLIFLALLPFKLQHIMTNLEKRFYASVTAATQKRSEKLFSSYLKNRVIPNLKVCGSTKNPTCNKSSAGASFGSRMFRGWQDGKLEQKLWENHGIWFENDKFSKTPKMYLKADTRGIDLTDAVLNKDFDAMLSGRKDIRAALRAGLYDETHSNNVLTRYRNRKLAARSYGIPPCIFFCNSRDDFADWKNHKSRIAKLKLTQLAVKPLGDRTGLLFECLVSGDCGANKGRSLDSKPLTEFDVRNAKKISELSSKIGSEKVNDIIKLSDDINKAGGFKNYVFDKVLSTIIEKDVVKKGILNGIPVVGWIVLAAKIIHVAGNSGDQIKKMVYETNSVAMAQHAGTYMTFADEMKSGNVDPQIVGSMVESLGENTPNGEPAENSHLYQSIFGGTGSAITKSNSLNWFASISSGKSSYTCDDNKPLDQTKLICPEESLVTENIFTNMSNAFKVSPLKEVSSLAETITKVTEATFGWLSKPLELIGNIPIIGDAQKWVAEQTSKLLEPIKTAFKNYFLPQPLRAPGEMSGARNFNMIAGGVNVMGNNSGEYTIGGTRLTSRQSSEIKKYAFELNKDLLSQKPLLARIFDINQEDSVTAHFAMSMPTGPNTLKSSVSGLALNPFSPVTKLASAALTNPAMAAGIDTEDPFGIPQMGIPINDPVFDIDPELLTDESCSPSGEIFKTWNDATAVDEKTGSIYHTTVNPCLLERTATTASGAWFTDDVIADLDKDSGSTTSQSSANTSPTTPQGPKRQDTSQMACVAGTKSEEIYSVGDGPLTPVNIKLCNLGPVKVNAMWSTVVKKMLDDAAAEGVSLSGGGFRTYQTQLKLRRQNCGASTYAIYEMPSGSCRPPTAKPGHSNHELGLAIDFNNCNSRSSQCYQWLKKYANPNIVNLPSEPWHWSIDGN